MGLAFEAWVYAIARCPEDWSSTTTSATSFRNRSGAPSVRAFADGWERRLFTRQRSDVELAGDPHLASETLRKRHPHTVAIEAEPSHPAQCNPPPQSNDCPNHCLLAAITAYIDGKSAKLNSRSLVRPSTTSSCGGVGRLENSELFEAMSWLAMDESSD